MPVIQHITDSDLRRLALDRVVPSLLELGFYYVDNFLGDLVGDIVLEQVKDMHSAGILQDGRLAATGTPGSVPGLPQIMIRGDKIAWVSGAERNCEAISFLLTLIDKLISLCIGRLGKRMIRERSKVSAMTRHEGARSQMDRNSRWERV